MVQLPCIASNDCLTVISYTDSVPIPTIIKISTVYQGRQLNGTSSDRSVFDSFNKRPNAPHRSRHQTPSSHHVHRPSTRIHETNASQCTRLHVSKCTTFHQRILLDRLESLAKMVATHWYRPHDEHHTTQFLLRQRQQFFSARVLCFIIPCPSQDQHRCQRLDRMQLFVWGKVHVTKF